MNVPRVQELSILFHKPLNFFEVISKIWTEIVALKSGDKPENIIAGTNVL
jgi:hypothetical protein